MAHEDVKKLNSNMVNIALAEKCVTLFSFCPCRWPKWV